MQHVNIHEAKTHLSRLIEAVERGEEVVIARAGQPVATLCRYQPPRRRIAPPGSMAGADWWMADDFDDPVDDLFECLHDDAARERGADAVHEPPPPAGGPAP